MGREDDSVNTHTFIAVQGHSPILHADYPLTHSAHPHRIPPNMNSLRSEHFYMMTMTTTTHLPREEFARSVEMK
jgi:hypothetical protein